MLSKLDLNEHWGDLLAPLARCVMQSENSVQDEQQTARLNSWERGTVFRWPTVQDSIFILKSPFRNAACTSAVSRTHFSRPLLALIASRTLIASRQAVGESLRMSNTSGSAYPGTTIRADAFVSKGFSAVLFTFVFVYENKP